MAGNENTPFVIGDTSSNDCFFFLWWLIIPYPPKINSKHLLKNDGWKTILSFWDDTFSGANCSTSREYCISGGSWYHSVKISQWITCIKIRGSSLWVACWSISASDTDTSYKWSYGPHEWPYKWVCPNDSTIFRHQKFHAANDWLGVWVGALDLWDPPMKGLVT